MRVVTYVLGARNVIEVNPMQVTSMWVGNAGRYSMRLSSGDVHEIDKGGYERIKAVIDGFEILPSELLVSNRAQRRTRDIGR